MKKLKNQVKGITLISLVVTIIILLILSGVTIGVLSNGGIIGQAKDAVKATKLAEVKEQLSIDILSAQMEGLITGNVLTDEKLKDIVDKYGELGEDGDTIQTENGDLSLKDILEGNVETTVDKDKQIADLENTVEGLEGTIEDLNKQLEDEKNKKTELENTITDLNNQVNGLNEEVENLRNEVETGKVIIAEKEQEIENLNTQIASKNEELENKNTTINNLENTVASLNQQIVNLNTQVANLTKKQATGNAGVGQVLNGYKFSNSSGVGLTGTMPNRGALNWSGNNTTYSVPAGYYSGGTLDSRPSYNAGYNAGASASKTKYNMSATIPSSRFILITMFTSSHFADKVDTNAPTVSLTNATIESVSYRNGLIAKSGYSSIGGNYCLIFAICKNGVVGANTQVSVSIKQGTSTTKVWNGSQMGTAGNLSLPIMISL